jgi:hypothetical protein
MLHSRTNNKVVENLKHFKKWFFVSFVKSLIANPAKLERYVLFVYVSNCPTFNLSNYSIILIYLSKCSVAQLSKASSSLRKHNFLITITKLRGVISLLLVTFDVVISFQIVTTCCCITDRQIRVEVKRHIIQNVK